MAPLALTSEKENNAWACSSVLTAPSDRPTGEAKALLVPVQSLSQQTLPGRQAQCWVLGIQQ